MTRIINFGSSALLIFGRTVVRTVKLASILFPCALLAYPAGILAFAVVVEDLRMRACMHAFIYSFALQALMLFLWFSSFVLEELQDAELFCKVKAIAELVAHYIFAFVINLYVMGNCLMLLIAEFSRMAGLKVMPDCFGIPSYTVKFVNVVAF